MKRQDIKNNELQKSVYTPAEVKILDFTGSSIICQSGTINDMTVDQEAGGSFYVPNSLLF